MIKYMVVSQIDCSSGILDASAGVEAQTKTVWKQANRFSLPRLVYLNKMDKRGADVDMSVKTIQTDLQTKPLLTQLNIGVEKDFEGELQKFCANLFRNCFTIH